MIPAPGLRSPSHTLEDHRQQNRLLPGRIFHLGAVDEARSGKLELKIYLPRLVETDGWAGAGAADQGKVDPGVHGRTANQVSGHVFGTASEGHKEASCFPGGCRAPCRSGRSDDPDLIAHAPEKTGKLLHRVPEAQFDDAVYHCGVVDIDPEREPLVPTVERSEIKGPHHLSFLVATEFLRPRMAP